MRIDNLLGRVQIRGVARPGEIHIIAEKRAATLDALGRLRVHYTAFEGGEVVVDTRVELGGRERSLPLAGSGIDLIVDVPPDVAVEAKTFGGDVSVLGLRAGAKLETTGGAHRRPGRARRRGHAPAARRPARRGGRGRRRLDGVEGDLDLRNVGGGRVDARVVDGTIRAEDLRSGYVRLVTTTGQIVLFGHDPARLPLRPAQLRGRRARRADRGHGVRPARALVEAAGDGRAAAGVAPGGRLAAGRVRVARRSPPARARAALVELSSVLGGVEIQISHGRRRPPR